jgi:hypothetical protein
VYSGTEEYLKPRCGAQILLNPLISKCFLVFKKSLKINGLQKEQIPCIIFAANTLQ